MPADSIRIFSDVHYGDRASRVRKFDELRPLFSETDVVVLNGDTLDTRVGPRPEHTAACRSEVLEFAAHAGAEVLFLTGNHDPDFSPHHSLELSDNRVFVVHGDVLFDNIVPWGRDARSIGEKISAIVGTKGRSVPVNLSLEERLQIWRTVAASMPQRHQSERNPWKYAARFAMDTIWPPDRFLKIRQAWRSEAELAAALVAAHRPQARYVLLGHTHRPAIHRIPGGPTVINTGSFTAPFGGYAVDLGPDTLRVRRIERRNGAFHAGTLVVELPLHPA